jgi:hypothetical protein
MSKAQAKDGVGQPITTDEIFERLSRLTLYDKQVCRDVYLALMHLIEVEVLGPRGEMILPGILRIWARKAKGRGPRTFIRRGKEVTFPGYPDGVIPFVKMSRTFIHRFLKRGKINPRYVTADVEIFGSRETDELDDEV